jgi:hypothetical protein
MAYCFSECDKRSIKMLLKVDGPSDPLNFLMSALVIKGAIDQRLVLAAQFSVRVSGLTIERVPLRSLPMAAGIEHIKNNRPDSTLRAGPSHHPPPDIKIHARQVCRRCRHTEADVSRK